MSVLARVKRFFAKTIHGYGEVFSNRYVDFEVVSRNLMFDIRAFGKEIMAIPDHTDIFAASEESSNEREEETSPKSPGSMKSLKSMKSIMTFNVPDFESGLELDLDSYETDEPLFDCDDENDSDKKKRYGHDSYYKPEEEKVEGLKKRKHFLK